ncbi:hypothetical protein [Nonomuraea typhae]|uniref:hypothetical protein n=1 Tax=Nonomuraea typhae TaxID=2603600 RepID=UPI0012F7679C|nr:hypothetical protein [Nonomuraea typhae]
MALAAGLAVPPIRRRIAGYGRALLVRHRFQGLCRRTTLRTPDGRLPLVIHSARNGGDVAMLVWCRSGMSPALFDGYREEIKVACFAKDVSISVHWRWSHLVLLEVAF